MSRWVRTVFAGLIAALPVLPVAAQGPGPCGPRTEIIRRLAHEFGETPAGRGLAANGLLLELLVSPAGTWTLLISLPNGMSCFANAGEAWETLTPPGPLAHLDAVDSRETR